MVYCPYKDMPNPVPISIFGYQQKFILNDLESVPLKFHFETPSTDRMETSIDESG
jgi:hypothetical protein